MSILDKIAAAVMPPESAEERRDARIKATATAMPGDWLDQVLTHHLEIERCFEAVKNGADGQTRTDGLKRLAVVLTGHANAEESVIYPALADADEKAHASMGYEEQALVKVQMALMEKLDPMSRDFIDKLGHIQGAVAHHMYAEEGNWFLDLKDRASIDDQTHMTQRYAEEYSRYASPAPVA